MGGHFSQVDPRHREADQAKPTALRRAVADAARRTSVCVLRNEIRPEPDRFRTAVWPLGGLASPRRCGSSYSKVGVGVARSRSLHEAVPLHELFYLETAVR